MAEVHQMWEIAGIDVTKIVKIIIVLAATYLTAKIVQRALAKFFEKTPFPEEIENQFRIYNNPRHQKEKDL